MTGRGNNAEFMPQYDNRIAFMDYLRGSFARRLLRPIHNEVRITRQQRFNAACMVIVMMRQQNGDRLPRVFLYRFQNRCGFAWIDNQALSLFIAQHPYVVVLKSRNTVKIHKSPHITLRKVVMKPARTPAAFTAPAHWSQLPWGDFYRAALEQQLTPWLGKMYGFHLLKIGNLSAEVSTEACAISHQVNIAPQGETLQVKADPLHLPFAEKSVDACLLAHTLPWCPDPHRLLREVDRVLIDDGWMILSSFSPLSLLGAGKMVPFLRRKMPYNSRMFTMMRQLDWLTLLNFEVMHHGNFQVLPWHRQGGRLLSTHLPALGCMQLIVARKRTIPLTLNPMKARKAKAQLRPAVGATRQYRKP